MENVELKQEDNNTNTLLSAVKFIEWVVEILPPEYDLDVRHRFTPQVKLPNENELVWVETHKHTISNPKFYTTKEVYELWLANCR
jgi:hypothetical protein